MLVTTGGDDQGDGETQSLAPNPRPKWSAETLQSIKDGRLKRVLFWTAGELESSVQQQPEPKRRRKDQGDVCEGSGLGSDATRVEEKLRGPADPCDAGGGGCV